MKRFLLLVVAAVFMCGSVLAQKVNEPVEVTKTESKTEVKQRFDIGVGYWYTDGLLKGNAYANGRKFQEIKYDGIDAGLIVLNLDAWIFWRIYADASVAWASFDGKYKQENWAFADDMYNSRMTWGEAAELHGWDLNQPYFVSKSDATGDVTTWDANGYIRVLDKEEDKYYLDLSAGYFYYQDNIKHVENTVVVEELWETINTAYEEDSNDKYTFDGLRLGARGKVRLHDRIAVKASGGVCPWLTMENNMYLDSLLFNEYNQSKSKVTADAISYDLDISLEIKFTKNFFGEIGYKYVYIDSDKGDQKITFANNDVVVEKDAFDAEVKRGGFYGMLRLKF